MSEPRAELLGLIGYLGLSIGEAAGLIGIGHDTISKKLAGRARYEVRGSEVETLRRLADDVDLMVSRAVVRFNSGGDGDPTPHLLVYRHDRDMPDWADLPHASVHRLAMARIARSVGVVRLVTFDRDRYDAWRGSRPDDPVARSDWAAAVLGGEAR